MKITAEGLQAVYTMLRQFPPFDRWGLPDKIKFEASSKLENGPEAWAEYDCIDGKHEILFDTTRHWTMPLLVSVMAHEMGHCRQELIGKRPGNKDPHGTAWKKIAGVICKEQGYDIESF